MRQGLGPGREMRSVVLTKQRQDLEAAADCWQSGVLMEGGPRCLGSELSSLLSAFLTNLCLLEAHSSSVGMWEPPPGGNPTSFQAV